MGLAQLAERLVVVQEVAGSTPVAHPTEIGSRAGFHKGRTGYPVRPLLLTPGGPKKSDRGPELAATGLQR